MRYSLSPSLSHYTKLTNQHSWEGKPNIYTPYRAPGCRSLRSILLSLSTRRSTGPGKDERFQSSCEGRLTCDRDHRPVKSNALSLRTALQTSFVKPCSRACNSTPLHTHTLLFLFYFTFYDHGSQPSGQGQSDTSAARDLDRFYHPYGAADTYC